MSKKLLQLVDDKFPSMTVLRPYTIVCFFEYANAIRVAHSVDELNRACEYLRGFISGLSAALLLEPDHRDRMFQVLFNAEYIRRTELSGGVH